MEKPIVKIKLLPGGKMPEKKSADAAAWDCFAREDVVVGNNPVLIGLGFMAEPPKGYYLEIVPRSSTGLKTNLRQPNSIGVIDSDYRGEVKAMYESKIEERKVAHSGTVFNAPVYKCVGTATLIKAGDRIAQMKLCKKYDADLVVVEELSETERGTGGFGSTGTR